MNLVSALEAVRNLHERLVTIKALEGIPAAVASRRDTFAREDIGEELINLCEALGYYPPIPVEADRAIALSRKAMEPNHG